MQDNYRELGETLIKITDDLRGNMDAKDFGNFIFSFLFLRYLSLKYEAGEAIDFIIPPQYTWDEIAKLAHNKNDELKDRLIAVAHYIENEMLGDGFTGLITSTIDFDSSKLGRNATEQNVLLSKIVIQIDEGISAINTDVDIMGDAYEFLMDRFASGAGNKSGEFYTPQGVSTVLSKIIANHYKDSNKKISVFDFACGSGSLLLNMQKETQNNGAKEIQVYGQEKNVTTHNLAKMNMLLHGLKPSDFNIFNGDTLVNDWVLLNNNDSKMDFDAIVANPPFSLKWEHTPEVARDPRFISFGLAPKNKADIAFLLHGLHYLKNDGIMAVVFPHGVLFRGNAEELIRERLLTAGAEGYGYIDAVIGLPENLFYSTTIPTCILIIKKQRSNKDVLFINASNLFEEQKKKNRLTSQHIEKIVNTYVNRTEEDLLSRRVSLEEIKKNRYNLNISRYVSVEPIEELINLDEVNIDLVAINKEIEDLTAKFNADLADLGLKPI